MPVCAVHVSSPTWGVRVWGEINTWHPHKKHSERSERRKKYFLNRSVISHELCNVSRIIIGGEGEEESEEKKVGRNA